MSQRRNKDQRVVHVLGDYTPARGWRIAEIHPVHAVDHVTRSRACRWSAWLLLERIPSEEVAE